MALHLLLLALVLSQVHGAVRTASASAPSYYSGIYSNFTVYAEITKAASRLLGVMINATKAINSTFDYLGFSQRMGDDLENMKIVSNNASDILDFLEGAVRADPKLSVKQTQKIWMFEAIARAN